MIENLYVMDRQKSSAQGHNRENQKSHIPITVRQLEAIIRISEALAKMCLKTEVEADHVKEAHRLFQNSTMVAVSMGAKYFLFIIYRLKREFGLDLPQELKNIVSQIEESIKRRVSIGSRINYQRLIEELVSRFNNQRAVEFAIDQLVRQEDLQFIENRRMVYRKK